MTVRHCPTCNQDVSPTRGDSSTVLGWMCIGLAVALVVGFVTSALLHLGGPGLVTTRLGAQIPISGGEVDGALLGVILWCIGVVVGMVVWRPGRCPMCGHPNLGPPT
jgi:hypothetical protein